MDTVACKIHGNQQRTFVCQHIVEGLSQGRPVGFFWSIEDRGNPRSDAWCRACNERLRLTGGEWVGEALANLKAKLLCGACYDSAKAFHMAKDQYRGNPL